MGKIINILGKKFGRLSVEKFIGLIKKHAVWECRCNCGKITQVVGYRLRNGEIQSCGCLRIEKVTESLFKDLTGKKFSRLTVIGVEGKKNGGYFYKCKCDCGNIRYICGNKLSFGWTKSCGCLQKEVCSEKIKILIKKQRGKNHPRWRTDLSKKDRIDRSNRRCGTEPRSSRWRNKVYQRDNFTCKKCKQRSDGNLNAHHVKSWADYPKLRYRVNNGITFCKKCHRKFHKLYGYKHSIRKQLTEFLK